jgi:hypothetical protein
MRKFETWSEAYQLQLSLSEGQDGEIFPLWNGEVKTGISSLDDIPIHTQGIVWLAVSDNFANNDEGYENGFSVYGVNQYEQWGKLDLEINANGKIVSRKDRMTPDVASPDIFHSLDSLLRVDSNSLIIMENLEKIIEIYEFLRTGKINEGDSPKHYPALEKYLSMSKNPSSLQVEAFEDGNEEDENDYFDDLDLSFGYEDDFDDYCDEDFDDYCDEDEEELYSIYNEPMNCDISYENTDIEGDQKGTTVFRVSYATNLSLTDNKSQLAMSEQEANAMFNHLVGEGYVFVEVSEVRKQFIVYKK